MKNAHTPHDPDSEFRAVEVAFWAPRMDPCEACGANWRPLPMLGPPWGIELPHEDGCPADDQPAAVYHAADDAVSGADTDTH